MYQLVDVYNNARNRELYKDVPKVECGKYMKIESIYLAKHSNVRVMLRCDHCLEVYYAKMNDFTKTSEKHDGLSFCKKCRAYAQKLTLQEQYGVDNISQLEEVKKKKVETCRGHFGTDYPMQSKEVMDKSRASMLDKYGVDHNSHRPEIVDRVKIANAKVRGKNGTIMSSKAQRYLCNLLEGKLNYPCGYYNMDILLDDNTYIEYNGSGHNLNVTLGQITQAEFDRKEQIRYYYLKSQGYKCIIIDNLTDKLPQDDTILILVDTARSMLANNNWVRINFDDLSITTK